MEFKVKERIIGALVLLALASVILPILLDDDKSHAEFQTRIPVQNDNVDTPDIAMSQPRPIDELAVEFPVIAAETTLKNDDIREENIATDNSVLPVESNKNTTVSGGFIIQLGSFSNLENAQKLVNKLQKAGFKAYLRRENKDGQLLARVLEGPHISRTEAESKLSSLRKISGNTVLILPFDPLKH